jgi:hypothetical protein
MVYATQMCIIIGQNIFSSSSNTEFTEQMKIFFFFESLHCSLIKKYLNISVGVLFPVITKLFILGVQKNAGLYMGSILSFFPNLEAMLGCTGLALCLILHPLVVLVEKQFLLCSFVCSCY